MIRKILTSLVLAGALVASAAGAQSQDSANRPKDTSRVHTASGEVSLPKMPRIIGVYSTEGGVLEGVVVKDLFTSDSVITSPTGNAPLNFLTFKGNATLVLLRKPGYAPKQIVVQNDTTPVTEVLEPRPLGDTTKAVRLTGMEVNAKYNLAMDAGKWEGFEVRCATKNVACIKSDELMSHPSTSLASFLNKVSGVVPDCASSFSRGVRSRRNTASGGKIPDCIKMHGAGVRASMYCVPTFYVDGSMVGYAESSLNDIEEYLHSPSIKGVEVYLSDQVMPLRLGSAAGNEGCGTVAIWTR